jgi:hypothetical protein
MNREALKAEIESDGSIISPSLFEIVTAISSVFSASVNQTTLYHLYFFIQLSGLNLGRVSSIHSA